MSRESAIAVATGTPAPTPTGNSPGLAPAESPSPTEAPKVLESTRFAHLAKKEADLQRQREEFKAERAQVTSEKEKMRGIHEKLTQFEEMKVKDPVAALKLAGFSETDLFNFLSAAEDKSTPEEKAARAAQAEIKKFTDGQAQEKAIEIQKRDTAIIGNFKQNISKTMTADKDRYEYCNFHGPMAASLVFETVQAVLEDSGNVLPIKEAIDMVENYYEEQDGMMSSLKKRQPKEFVRPEANKIEYPRAEVSPRPTPKTISNKVTATTPGSVKRNETPGEKRERLIQKLRNGG